MGNKNTANVENIPSAAPAEGQPPAHSVNYSKRDKEDMEKLKFADELNNGPIMNRRCTDVFFCLFFIVFLCGMGAAFGYGFAYG